MVEIITGGPSSSGPAIPPCACAVVAASPSQTAATVETLVQWLIRGITLQPLKRTSQSLIGLDVFTDRPDRQVPANQLANPVANHRERTTEEERDILSLTQEAA